MYLKKVEQHLFDTSPSLSTIKFSHNKISRLLGEITLTSSSPKPSPSPSSSKLSSSSSPTLCLQLSGSLVVSNLFSLKAWQHVCFSDLLLQFDIYVLGVSDIAFSVTKHQALPNVNNCQPVTDKGRQSLDSGLIKIWLQRKHPAWSFIGSTFCSRFYIFARWCLWPLSRDHLWSDVFFIGSPPSQWTSEERLCLYYQDHLIL